jgi:SAM-dependent methyltransferase
MVTHAAARARSRHLGHVRFARMDAEDLSPLPDASFDAALCGLGLMYVPDPLKAVREMTRALVSGGRVVAAVWGQRSRCGWAEIFPIVDAHVKSEVCPLFFSLGTADRLADVFREAGLVDVMTERIETRLEWASDDDACGAAFVGGPVALAYSRFDARTRLHVRRDYLASISRWRVSGSPGTNGSQSTNGSHSTNGSSSPYGSSTNGDGDHGYAVPGEFVIVAGRKPSPVA